MGGSVDFIFTTSLLYYNGFKILSCVLLPTCILMINCYALKFSSHMNDAGNQLPRFVPRMYLPEMDKEFDSELKSVNYRSRSADDLLDSRKASVILYQLSKLQNLI